MKVFFVSRTNREFREEFSNACLFYLTYLGMTEEELKYVEIVIRTKKGVYDDDKEELRGSSQLLVFRKKKKKIRVELNNKADVGTPMLQTLAHELVHAKQYLRGELTNTDDLNWHGDPIEKPEDEEFDEYFHAPWEIEAHDKELVMYVAYMEHEIEKFEKSRR